MSGKHPLTRDSLLQYDIDSDDEWEEEEEEGCEELASEDEEEKVSHMGQSVTQ